MDNLSIRVPNTRLCKNCKQGDLYLEKIDNSYDDFFGNHVEISDYELRCNHANVCNMWEEYIDANYSVW